MGRKGRIEIDSMFWFIIGIVLLLVIITLYFSLKDKSISLISDSLPKIF